MQSDVILCEHLPPLQRSLRVAVVTETYPPEINGVARTVARFVEGLRDLNHEIQLIRPRQRSDDEALESRHEMLVRGIALPKYPGLQMGLPARSLLTHVWSRRRPDVVHIVTEGPLGWSAIRSASHLKIPLTSDFRTNFDAYSSYYGMGWGKSPSVRTCASFTTAR
jgi:Glycosyltransferase Family 4